MTDYREILRLNHLNYGLRQIAASVHSSHHTVSTVLELAQKHNISFPLDDVTNAEIEAILYPSRKNSGKQYAEPDYSYVHKELAKPGVTLTLLWNEYCEKCRAENILPYMSTQFGDTYRKWAKVTKATMRVTHKPGDAMQVDWAGNTIQYYESGIESAAYLFVAVLPCSCFAYVEACNDMKQENWLLCHIHAYEYLGGVTRLLIPDNLKTGVTSNTKYETRLNDSYRELADHYGTAIVPARVRHPQDKSLAEGTVKFASTWIIAALRECEFFSLSEVKSAVFKKLEELNDKPFQKQTGTRRSARINSGHLKLFNFSKMWYNRNKESTGGKGYEKSKAVYAGVQAGCSKLSIGTFRIVIAAMCKKSGHITFGITQMDRGKKWQRNSGNAWLRQLFQR